MCTRTHSLQRGRPAVSWNKRRSTPERGDASMPESNPWKRAHILNPATRIGPYVNALENSYFLRPRLSAEMGAVERRACSGLLLRQKRAQERECAETTKKAIDSTFSEGMSLFRCSRNSVCTLHKCKPWFISLSYTSSIPVHCRESSLRRGHRSVVD